MKKISFLFSIFILLTAFTCEDEPLEGDFVTDTELSCEIAALNTQDAAIAFLAVTEETYAELCTAYRNALIVQIQFCGDPDGTLQIQIDSLGDCGVVISDPCEAATAATTAAETVYNADTSNTDLCNAYKAALQNKITVCGDTNGSMQAIIDGLGDCTPTNTSGTLSVTAGTLNIQFITNSVALNSGLVIVNGSNTEQGANYHVYFEVSEGTTGVDVMQNFKLTLIGGDFFPNTDGFDDFTNNITVNSGGVIQGTFGGIVTRTDGADLNLAQGIVDLSY
ncbi:hypothetical protein [Psychroserpens jangbogonensis]|uniref:hypothetical protein n=1 Tax=Psychroserpens jangbogonensis TaxID=1484460 RepID=UPI00053F2652|nr:hypothetical protein [Psychroserpens jangbogonensis]